MKKLIIIFFLFSIVFTAYAQQKTNERIPGPSKVFKPTDAPLTSISVTPLSGSMTATDLVEAILGAGVTYSNVSFTGSTGESTSSAGLFTNGTAAGLGFNSGVILSSGYIQNAIGPNNSGSTTADLGLAGDGNLNALIPGYTTHDATILEFDFDLPATTINIQFEFGSEEYNEYVGSSYNDVFAFFLDGTNIALIPSTNKPVSINNVNNGSYPSYYYDNTSHTQDIECDGFTVLLTAQADIDPNTSHHIKLAIADAGDHILDSWVFLRESGFSGPVNVDLGPDITICSGETATLDAGAWGGTYLWSTNETTQTITVSTEGTYSCTVTTPYGSGSDDVYVTVIPPLTVNLGDDAILCNGQSKVLDAGNPGATYLWSPNGETTQTITVNSTGTYSVTVTDQGCTGSDAIDITAFQLSIDAGANQTVYYGYAPQSCATLTCSNPTGGTPPYSFLWSNGSTSQSITVCPTVTTTYTVTVTDANSCTISDQVKVCVIDVRCGNNMNKVLICHIPPGNTGNPQTLCVAASAVPAHLMHGDYLGACGTDPTCTGTQQPIIGIDLIEPANDEIILNAVPNPFNNHTTLTFICPDDGKVTITLTDLAGKVVSSFFNKNIRKNVEYRVELNGSDLSTGIYYCILRHSNGKIKVHKLLISK